MTIQRNWQYWVHKTQDEDKQKKKHNTICVGRHYAQTSTTSQSLIFCGWWTIVCFLVNVRLTIVLSVFLQFVAFGYPFVIYDICESTCSSRFHDITELITPKYSYYVNIFSVYSYWVIRCKYERYKYVRAYTFLFISSIIQDFKLFMSNYCIDFKQSTLCHSNCLTRWLRAGHCTWYIRLMRRYDGLKPLMMLDVTHTKNIVKHCSWTINHSQLLLLASRLSVYVVKFRYSWSPKNKKKYWQYK